MALKAAVVPVTPFQQNCAVLWDAEAGRGVVVDPGGEVPRILGALEELKVSVDRILLTHGHVDHASGAAELRDALAPYIGHGRKVGGRRGRGRAPRGGGDSVSAAQIRQWARENGWDVPERGRVSEEVRQAYAAAH